MDLDLLYKNSENMLKDFLTKEKPIMDITFFKQPTTAIIIVDMLNGFAKEGALYSNRIEALIQKQLDFLNDMSECQMVFLCDEHPEDASEFQVFLPHCVVGSEEAEIVKEFKPIAEKKCIIKKNSTNGYLEPEFQNWLNHQDLENIILIGCCTDLCVLQLALSLKTHYHLKKQHVSIIVPVELVDTYDVNAINHPGDVMHLVALKMMADNGIKIMTTGGMNDLD